MLRSTRWNLDTPVNTTFQPLPFRGQDFTNNLNILDMSEFWKIMEKDFQAEGFTAKELVIYGIIAPVVLVIGCVFADWIAK